MIMIRPLGISRWSLATHQSTNMHTHSHCRVSPVKPGASHKHKTLPASWTYRPTPPLAKSTTTPSPQREGRPELFCERRPPPLDHAATPT